MRIAGRVAARARGRRRRCPALRRVARATRNASMRGTDGPGELVVIEGGDREAGERRRVAGLAIALAVDRAGVRRCMTRAARARRAGERARRGRARSAVAPLAHHAMALLEPPACQRVIEAIAPAEGGPARVEALPAMIEVALVACLHANRPLRVQAFVRGDARGERCVTRGACRARDLRGVCDVTLDAGERGMARDQRAGRRDELARGHRRWRRSWTRRRSARGEHRGQRDHEARASSKRECSRRRAGTAWAEMESAHSPHSHATTRLDVTNPRIYSRPQIASWLRFAALSTMAESRRVTS